VKQSIRLLILDDDPLTAKTIVTIAHSVGVETRSTESPGEFFEIVQDWAPDYIALDLVMPDMDGVQVMVELARMGCDADIVITSGVGGRVLEAAARSASEHGLRIAGVLPKPFSAASLRSFLKDPKSHGWYENTDTVSDPGGQENKVCIDDLRQAISHGQISVVYQPKVNCRNSTLAGFEALARWQHPERGIVGPNEFIPLAEQHGLIDELTGTVMQQALNWLAGLPASLENTADNAYLRRRLRNVTLSLNISASSLSNLQLFEQMDDYCQSLGIAPERVILELTETCAMDDPVSSLDVLTRLRMKGFHLSIDDFGTGYSSMVQLARLPFSEIKIDKSFVMTAASSKESRTVIKAIIELGHGLGLYTSAEGIETAETLEYLRNMGCDLAQGFHVAHPMPGDAILGWLRAGRNEDEIYRLQVLRSLKILDTEEDERIDRVTALAARLFDVPIALFSLVASERQWFKSSHGLEARETPRSVSFCSHAIGGDDVMVVADATADERFQNTALVTGEPFIRFYAGSPIHAGSGARLGTLCLIDRKPRTLSEGGKWKLERLAQMLENELTSDYVAHRDTLTGLLNRRGFNARARDVLALAQDAGTHATLFLFDLVSFKKFNEDHGPAAGDRALLEFSRVLKDTFRKSDLMARYGDDDFVVLMVDVSPPDHHRLLARVAMHHRVSVQEHAIDYTVGWSVLDGADTVQELVLRASETAQVIRSE
jgi:diguanylate cyclase (GGDEF)-like protein